MASQLGETLRLFCGEIGWTYAIFWRAIGDRNLTHLVWEDGYWDRGSTSTGVELLVSKIMAPQAHAFGDGIVGQAASRGNHLWILRDTTNLIGLGSKDFTELNHQFMAGIQTIAVIPVLPLGVLQLASSQTVMENIGFVNSVVNCFPQLGCGRALLRGFTETVLPQSTRPYNAVPAIASEVLPDLVALTINQRLNGSVHPMIHPLDKIFKQSHHLKTGQEISADHSGIFLTPLSCVDTKKAETFDSDRLLEAVVSKINFGAKQNSDDNSYSKTSENKISGFLLPDVSPNYKLAESSKQLQEEPFGGSHVLGKAGAAGTRSIISSSSLGNITVECPPTTRVCKSQVNVLTEVDQSMKCESLSGVQNKRVGEDSKLNRKKSKSGENPRGRPKDRQMIMDRVKELREIIPNGAKSSIDALLEKIIKHMLFFQTVTKHGEKLKDIGEPKFINREGNLNLKENFRGAATWAYEVGTQPMACPIVVEDLNPPRQMLVEMLCEQRGLFLETAEFIRGLGLTILKGDMEVCKDKIWASFAIEANRDVTRMEIFVSLVHLL